MPPSHLHLHTSLLLIDQLQLTAEGVSNRAHCFVHYRGTIIISEAKDGG